MSTWSSWRISNLWNSRCRCCKPNCRVVFDFWLFSSFSFLFHFSFPFQWIFFSFPCHLRFSWPAIDGNFGGKLKDLCLLSLLLSLYLTLSLSLPFPLCVFSLCMRFKMQLTAVFIQWTAAFHAQFVAILIMKFKTRKIYCTIIAGNFVQIPYICI